jgi:hypothetical protein
MTRWRRFGTNKGALGGLGFLVTLCGVTGLAWTFAPHGSMGDGVPSVYLADLGIPPRD